MVCVYSIHMYALSPIYSYDYHRNHGLVAIFMTFATKDTTWHTNIIFRKFLNLFRFRSSSYIHFSPIEFVPGLFLKLGCGLLRRISQKFNLNVCVSQKFKLYSWFPCVGLDLTQKGK